MRVLVEVPDPAATGLVQDALRVDLGIRLEVAPVPIGSLPRWALKAKRVVRR